MVKRAGLLAPVVLVIALGLSACGGGAETEAAESENNAPAAEETSEVAEEASVNESMVEAGRELYDTGGPTGTACSTCHTLDGTTLVGPSFQGIADRAGDRVSGMTAEEYIHQSIVDPSAHIVEGYDDLMPAIYGQQLSDEQVNELVAFLMTQ